MTLTFPRRPTREVRVGTNTIGGLHPVLVQSMATANTRDIEATANEIQRLFEAGCEMARVTTPTLFDAEACGPLKQELLRRSITIPLVADVHHEGMAIAIEAARHVDKVRVNPGLFVFRRRSREIDYSEEEHRLALQEIEEQMLPVIQACKARDIAMRVGVNHGSLSDRIMVAHGDTPEGMVEAALEFVRICRKHDYNNLVLSLKASRVQIMLAANRLAAKRMADEGMDYPIHLGVTEAGNGDYARIKSTAGIATLLAEGIGDTIRVSLAEDPVNEIPVCYDILQALNLRKTKVEFIACPSCGRTKFDLPSVLNEVKAATGHLVGLDIAVMGCIVNGPGEMADADYGYVGRGGGTISLYRGREIVKNGIPERRGVQELVALIKADGRWVEPGITVSIS